MLHMASIHKDSSDKLKSSDEVIKLTQSYWKTGRSQPNLQVYINALMNIEKANIGKAIEEMEEIKLEDLWKQIQEANAKYSPFHIK